MRSGHFFVLFPFVFAAQVAAHGYVKTVTIDDKAYAGNIPYRAPSSKPYPESVRVRTHVNLLAIQRTVPFV